MLNTYSFSPFHVLVVVTITTIPLVLWNLSRSKFLEFKKGLLYNFIGLNLAMIGAFEPDRYVGRRLHLTIEIWAGLMVLAIIFSVYIIIQANRKPNFFK
jgi:ABC-type phosphate/phosphonate transport system permease subunit